MGPLIFDRLWLFVYVCHLAHMATSDSVLDSLITVGDLITQSPYTRTIQL